MYIVEHVVRAHMRGAQPLVDTVALSWEQRQRSRQRLRTVQGRDLALALPTGTQLRAGDLLPTSDGCIEVALAPEEVLLIRPRSPQEAAFVAYQIGNRHLPLEICQQGLKTLYEPTLETYLTRQHIPVERAQLPFTPVSATSGHQHA